jgi:hypothetical protein
MINLWLCQLMEPLVGPTAAQVSNMARCQRIPLYLARSKDGGILFDLCRNRFLKLNAVGIEIWIALSKEVPRQQVMAETANHYNVALEAVTKDVDELIIRASGLGIHPGPLQEVALEDDHNSETRPSFPWYGDGPGKRPRPRKLQVLLALCGLLTFDLLLSAGSMYGLCSAVQRWPRRNRSRAGTLAGEVCTAVDKACVWYPRKALCLQRSAVTTCLLRLYGLPATMTIAARPVPFMAHAWVEMDGAVVNDHPGVRNLYTTLARF